MPVNIFQQAIKASTPLSAKDLVGPKPDNDENNLPPRLTDLVLTADELMKYVAKPSKIWINPFLTSGSIVIVSAKRGTGKTWFTLQMAVSLAQGTCFLEYDVPHKAKILIIDGEMRICDIRQRIEMLAEKTIPQNIVLLSSERTFQNYGALNIEDPECQNEIIEAINEHQPDIVIFDNLSSLSYGRDENSNSDLDKLIQFLIRLRHMDIAVVVVHHHGRNGTIRGASRLEDIVNYSIDLKEKATAADVTSFEIRFSKCRGEKPIPFCPTCKLMKSESGFEFLCDAHLIEPTNEIKILRALNEKQFKNQKCLAEELEINKGTVSNILKELNIKGMATKNPPQITSKGKDHLNKFQKYKL